MFIYGVYLWGCAWEKATQELQEAPPKNAPHALPVIHVQAVPQSEKPNSGDAMKASLYECPCFASRIGNRDVVLSIDIDQKEVSAAKWALRGISCTLRPF